MFNLSNFLGSLQKIAPFAIVYFDKKYYLTIEKNKHYSNG